MEKDHFTSQSEYIEIPSRLTNTGLQIIIFKQSLNCMEENSIRNMSDLVSFTIIDSPVEYISPRSFLNVPELRSIYISGTNMYMLSSETFNLIPNLQFLEMINNKIDYIENYAFKNLNLKRLSLKHNKLKEFDPNWFKNTKIIDITFGSNVIEKIPREAFKFVENIKSIDFGDNKISVIEPEAFAYVNKLEYLNLENNKLKKFDESIIPIHLTVTKLEIGGNNLNFLPMKLMKKLVVKYVSLRRNPWDCICVENIQNWLYFTNGNLIPSTSCTLRYNLNQPIEPYCIYSSKCIRKCIEDVDEELTKIYESKMKSSNRSLKIECS